MSAYPAHILAGASVLAMTAAGAVQAQEVYGGAGLASVSPNFAASFRAPTAMLGALWGDTALKYGLEGQFSASPDLTNLSYTNLILRGIISYDLGKARVFGAAGAASLRETIVLRGGGTVTNTYTGANFGLGAEFEATDRVRIRLEGNRENLTGGRHMDTVSLGVLFDF